MVGAMFLFFISNAIIFSFLFWALTFISKIFYTNRYYNYKLNFYECGFKSGSSQKINYEINYTMLLLFLLVYDGEFLILLPFALNSYMPHLHVLAAVLFFFLWLLIALLYDYSYHALEWQLFV